MFDFDSQFSSTKTARIVATQAVEHSDEQRRRDVFDSHRHRTFGVAYYMTGNELEAEQILTDTFVQAFSKTAEPDAHGVDLALVDELQKRFPLAEMEVSASPSAQPGMGNRNIRRTELEEALRELPPVERLLFLLRDVEGYSSEKISQLVKIPVANVQRALFSARIRMRNVLSEMAAGREAA